MHVKEIWRYPVKSMAGESPDRVQIERLGLADDRKVLVCDAQSRVITSRTHHGLLGLKRPRSFGTCSKRDWARRPAYLLRRIGAIRRAPAPRGDGRRHRRFRS
jgi:hypothetical protein